MNSPQISVIVPLYNARRFLRTCIESILQQTFEDFELIVVDDQSTDGSLDFVRENYSDPRIKTFQNIKNLGDAGTRNAGLGISKGKYIYFMDDDDAIFPQTLETLFNTAEESQAEVVHMNSHYATFDENFSLDGDIDVTKILDHDPTPRFVTEILIDRLRAECEMLAVDVMPWKKFSRRDFLFKNQLYFPLCKCCNDMFQLFGELCLAKKILIIDSCCYICRVHRGSQVHLDAKSNLYRAVESLPILISYLEDIFTRELIQPLPRSEQLRIEEFAVKIVLQIFAWKAYEEFPIDEVDSMLADSISKINSPDLTRIFFHLTRSNFLKMLKRDDV
ncbi:MAG: glycosyltransferase [Selenomonadaceae bacterium]|nr:glycosyltransferase [Selenomonadaceae bacterium]